jgi:hypothetical protein
MLYLINNKLDQFVISVPKVKVNTTNKKVSNILGMSHEKTTNFNEWQIKI